MKQKFLFFLLILLLGSAGAFAADYDFSAVNNDGATIYYKITSSDEPRTVMVTYRVYGGFDHAYSGIVNIPETVSPPTQSR